jgi:small subunit ribosomal protein S1
VSVRILEVDAERRRLSLSLKRVDDGMPVQPLPGEDAAPPTIDLSEDVFADDAAAAPVAESSDDPESSDDEVEDDEAEIDEPDESTDEDVLDEPESAGEPAAEGSDEPVPAE